VLADEINRTTPRTQSALLEAMSEEQVSVENRRSRSAAVHGGGDAEPVRVRGHLPPAGEPARRFVLKISVGYPPRTSEHRILTQQPGGTRSINSSRCCSAADVVAMQDAVPLVRLVRGSSSTFWTGRKHPPPRALHLGISTRGALALTAATQSAAVMAGRDHVCRRRQSLFLACCAHRVISKAYLGNGDAEATNRVLQSISRPGAGAEVMVGRRTVARDGRSVPAGDPCDALQRARASMAKREPRSSPAPRRRRG
jgi:MoxR-like ATPase